MTLSTEKRHDYMMDEMKALDEIELRVNDLKSTIKKYHKHVDTLKKPSTEHLLVSVMMVMTLSAVSTASEQIRITRLMLEENKKPPVTADGKCDPVAK